MSRAQRAQIHHRAQEIRRTSQRDGMDVPTICRAILQELPELLPLEARRLAFGWSRQQAIDRIAALCEQDGQDKPRLNSSMLCKWEHGVVLPSVEYWAVLSRVYGVSPAELGLQAPKRRAAPGTTRPRTVTVTGDADTGGEPVRRRELLTATSLIVPLSLLQRVEDALAAPPDPLRPESLRQVRVRLQQAHHLNDVAALNALVAAFPALLASAREMAYRTDTPAGYSLLSECYVLMVRTFNKIGHGSAARLAVERALLIAERSGDPAMIGSASRLMGMLLRKERRFGPAARVMERGISDLEAAKLRTSQQAQTYLRLHCALAYTMAWAGKEREAVDRIGEVERIAGRLSSLAGPGMGVPGVRLYRANIHYALGDPEQALHLAEELRPQMFPTPERRARYRTDVARSAWAADRPEETARALLGAIADAPGEVLERPGNRRIAGDLVTHYPRVAGARELAAAIGRP
ncbi:hypothetical protein ACFFWE_09680 [Sphaerisporangium melleum]|nr:transcriptional regulator [Sphaerisporangium melleum]